MKQQENNQQQPKKSGNSNMLTTRQGHPVFDNQNLRTLGSRGPATLENYQFLEKMSHFDRERVPERVVHARGAGAHGYFEAYGTVGDEPVAKYTRAKVFFGKGQENAVVCTFFNGDTRRTLSRNTERPTRLCG